MKKKLYKKDSIWGDKSQIKTTKRGNYIKKRLEKRYKNKKDILKEETYIKKKYILKKKLTIQKKN